MQTRLFELYNMENANRAGFLNGLTQEELNATLLDASKCVKAIQELEPMYDELKKYESKFSSSILNIWWLINRKAKEKILSEYNSLREKALAIWKNPEFSLAKLLDVEAAPILAKYPNAHWDNETNVVVSWALLNVKIKLLREVNPHILEKFPE